MKIYILYGFAPITELFGVFFMYQLMEIYTLQYLHIESLFLFLVQNLN